MSLTPEQQKIESRDTLKQAPEQKAAFQETFTGDYKANFNINGQEKMVKVRPLTESDISEIIGAISLNTEQKEQAVKEALDLSEPQNDEELIEKGNEAKAQTLDTTEALKGQVRFLNELRTLVMNGLTRKSAEIFILEPEQADYIFNVKQSELRAPNLNVAPDYSDVDSLSSQFALVTTPQVGEKLKELFVDNGHRIKEIPSGTGFQAEIGNLSLAFLYPKEPVEKNEIPKTEENKILDEQEKNTDNVVSLNAPQEDAYKKAA